MSARNKPVLVKLKGGLGNQMFQFGVASIIAKENNSKVLVEDLFFQGNNGTLKKFPRQLDIRIFNGSLQIATEKDINFFTQLSYFNRLRKKLGMNYPYFFEESSYKFSPKVLDLKPPVYLDGYFQSYKYFKGEEDRIRRLFSFPEEELGNNNEEIKRKILRKKSVSIHVRRGDYVENKKTQEFHGNCTIDYYKEAIQYLSLGISDFQIIFFSDDISWVKERFKDVPNEKIFVQGNLYGESWKDMYLMSLCDANIIANSSFSWWAAYLNNNPNKKIVAPIRWFADIEQENQAGDLIPPDWFRI
jgi:hypothetical protein